MIEILDEVGVLDSVAVSIVDLPAIEEIAYVLTDVHFPSGEFEVYRRESAAGLDAWWMDKAKVERLIEAFKQNAPVRTALAHAGISRMQYFRFREVHPHWDELKEQLVELPMMGFLNTIHTKGKEDLATSRWYIDRLHPRFATKVHMESEEPLQPTISQTNNIIINADADARVIQEAIRGIALEIFGHRRAAREGTLGTAPALEGRTEE